MDMCKLDAFSQGLKPGPPQPFLGTTKQLAEKGPNPKQTLD
jgi:hypothetical protein